MNWSYWDWSAALRDASIITMGVLAVLWTVLEILDGRWGS
jgi:hypothetical protein